MAGRDTVENVDVNLTAKDKASPVVDKLADKVEGLDDVELSLEATDNATATIARVDKAADALDATDVTVEAELSPTAKRLEADIHGILDEARNLDRADVELDVHLDGADRAARGLDDVADKADRVKREVPSSVDPLRDVSGSLGDIGGGALDASEGLLGVAEILPQLIPQLEGMAGALGSAGLAVAVGGLLYAGLQALPGLLGGVSEKDRIAEQATKDLTKAFLDQGVTVETLNSELTKFLKDNPELVHAMNALGISAADFRAEMVGGTNPAVERARTLWGLWQEQLDRWGTSNQENTEGIRALSKETGISEDSLRTLLPQIEKVVDAVDGQAKGYAEANKAAGEYQHAIDGLARDRHGSVTVDVSADTKPAEQDLADWIHEVSKKTVFVDIQGRTHAPGAGAMAGTPYAPGGMMTVGEAGPERVFLPRGSRVLTAGATAALERREAAGAGGVVQYFVTVNVPLGAPTASVGRYVADALALHEQRTGSRRRVLP